jgi:hypothetical protein
MNYTLLVAELRDDPQDRDYADMTDAQVADDLNTPRVFVWVPGSNVTTSVSWLTVLCSTYSALCS